MKILLTAMFVIFFIQENHPPVVKIILPKRDVKWDSPLRYSISVSDKEDGNTKFNEIPANEVLLEVRVVSDTADMQSLKNDRSALHAMIASNCLNCHAFNSKLIGPSFYDISKRKSDVNDLVKHVREGSKGIWGDIIMPTHPELSVEETEKMVKWILENSADTTINYYTGTEGIITIKNKGPLNKRSAVIMTANYIDHNGAEGIDKIIFPLNK